MNDQFLTYVLFVWNKYRPTAYQKQYNYPLYHLQEMF